MKTRRGVQSIFFNIRENFEISAFEISSVDCICYFIVYYSLFSYAHFMLRVGLIWVAMVMEKYLENENFSRSG